MAAVLASGTEALLSHRSAAALWGFLETARPQIDVTTPRRDRRARPGIDLHRVRTLHPDNRAVRDSIPVTSVARTLLDIAEVVRFRRLMAAFEQAERLGLLDVGALRSLCERSRGRSALKPIGRLLLLAHEPPDTRSELERRFVDLCRESDLPTPVLNADVAGLTVDALWPDERLVVELDGFAYHGTRAAFEGDRVRDERLHRAGYRVLRVTYRRLENDREGVVHALRSLLAGDIRVPLTVGGLKV
jgi:hypothetical protein